MLACDVGPSLESQTVQAEAAATMVKDATVSPTAASPTSTVGSSSPLFDRRERKDYWPLIGTKDDIPGWLRDNNFIVGGHPMPTSSYRRSLRLWRCLHMETMNIWTHLVGSVACIATGIGLYRHVSASSTFHVTSGDAFAFGSFLSCAAVCFGLSTGFHTLRSHSYNIHHLWGKMDILGICGLSLGAGASMNYYVMYCQPTAQRVYWGLTVGSAIVAGITLFDTGGGGNKMRTLRGGVFILLALSAMLPLFHGLGVLGWDGACEQAGAWWYVAEGLSLLTGVSLFVTRLPERLSPGTFDVWGHSHQLHHAFAVLGGAFHVVGLVQGFRYRQMNPGC